METDIFQIKNTEKETDGLRMRQHCASAAIRGRRGAATTSYNLGFPAVGNGVGALVRPSLTPPPTDTMGSASVCGNPWSLRAMTADLRKGSIYG